MEAGLLRCPGKFSMEIARRMFHAPGKRLTSKAQHTITPGRVQ
jgi:hypothetical protein